MFIMSIQKKNQIPFMMLIILLIFSGTGLISVLLLNTNNGTLDVSTITIPAENFRLTGLLYKPIDASESNPLPVVICAHGFSGSKYTMSGLALEIARRGFVALSLDLSGHGNSDSLGDDPTLGISATIDYIESIQYINSSLIGVVGHSMGAGAAKATALDHGNITATVLIGAVGISSNATIFKEFNSTFPNNLLIAIGEYDEFYADVGEFKTLLMPLFGTPIPIIPNYAFYGSFSLERQDARRLIISKTNHILETADPYIISEVIEWMQNSFEPLGYVDDYFLPQSDLIFTYREIASFITLVSIIGLIFLIISFVYDFPRFSREKQLLNLDDIEISLWRSSLLWGCLVIVLFLPVSIIGSLVPILPLAFAGSLALWFLLVNACLFLFVSFFPKHFDLSLDLRKFILNNYRNLWTRDGIIFAVGGIIGLYFVMFGLSSLFSIQLGFVVGIFSNLLVIERALSFVILLPIFLVYFLIDGLIFHGFIDKKKNEPDLRNDLINISKLLLAKAWPFLIVAIPYYVGRVLLGIHLLPAGLFALLFQFYWVIGLFFLGGTLISRFWYRFSNSITPGAVFNSLLFTWILSGFLPLV